jgi:hypothetical protein
VNKFDELCAAFAEGRTNAIAERNSAWNFANKVVAGFKNYLEYPDQLEFVPVVSQPKPGMMYSLPSALEIGKDSFWHIGVIIIIYAAKNQFPQFRGLIDRSFKKSGEVFIVKPAPTASEVKTQGDSPEDLKPVYEMLFSMIKGCFVETGGASDERVNKIGFV